MQKMSTNGPKRFAGTWRIFWRLLACLSVAIGFLTATTTPVLAEAPAPLPSAANFEVKFMQDMIDHHMMAIMEAEICLENAISGELRSLCQEIIVAQHHEMVMIQTWLSEWYGITYEPVMKPGEMKMLERLASFEGEEFEIEFMEMMIKHHSQAVKEGEKCLRKAFHIDLLNMCEDILETQSAEIMQMQTWLCEWYGICQKQ
jgi:uncharacterized protein (DUF305 family)